MQLANVATVTNLTIKFIKAGKYSVIAMFENCAIECTLFS